MNTPLISTEAYLSKRDRAAQHVVVVGGGIAGLSAAWYLQQEASRQAIEVTVTVLERSNQWGGKIQTEQVVGSGDVPFILEAGPDAFLTRKPWALELARELGLSERILKVNQQNSRTFVLHGGKPIPLPEGLQLLVPTRLMPFLRSPLFSWWGKIRVGLERFIPPHASGEDETLADFVCRRLGAEALDRLAEPLLSGVYNAEPEQQSIQATFPQFPALEKRYGSLLRGMQESQRERVPDDTPPFISFENGTHELINALVNQLRGDLRLNAVVHSITKDDATGYQLRMEDGSAVSADAVILATPAKVSAVLLREVAPQASDQLSAIRYASIGAAYVGFRRRDVPHPLNGFGVVIPSSEGRSIDGMTWITSKWNHRAPSDHVLLRVFFGGPHTRSMMDLEDAQVMKIVCDELRTVLGIQTQPLFQRIFRWQDGYPQYDLGHLERVAAIERALPDGLLVTGSSYRGVGVPDCVKQGQAAARQALDRLGTLQSVSSVAI